MSYKSQQLIKDHDVKWVDLRFTDTKGKQQHVTMPCPMNSSKPARCSTVPPSPVGKASKPPT